MIKISATIMREYLLHRDVAKSYGQIVFFYGFCCDIFRFRNRHFGNRRFVTIHILDMC